MNIVHMSARDLTDGWLESVATRWRAAVSC